ncbi:viperin family antiviral radical SAM protein [Ursidibacter arcticus]
MKELTINWHITEACNFKCTYCFAHWENKPCKREILHSSDDICMLLNELEKLPYLFPDKFDTIRLNLVGGETFLYRSAILNIIEEAKKRKFRLSAITNGSKLDPELNKIIADNFSIIGFSVDSISDTTNLAIGRKEKNVAIQIDELVKHIYEIRKYKPSIKLKINTVVNKLNHFEDLNSFIQETKPNKWKIFKMLPILPSSDPLKITDEQFHMFLERHQKHLDIISHENNDEMTETYLMIDPNGRFFQNGKNQEKYTYSLEIHKVGIETAFSQIRFDIDKFKQRYKK